MHYPDLRLDPLDRGPMAGFLIILAAAIGASAAVATFALPWEKSLTSLPLVYDGDTLRVEQKTVRLLGIDAPEMGQQCTPFGNAGPPFDCGARAREELEHFIARRDVHCKLRGKDKYSRHLGFCSVAGKDLGLHLVSRGWAITYGDSSYKYAEAEANAKAERLGIWNTYHDNPSVWRSRK